MKRKFFQILMMVAVTVTLGVFVSCKDTNEDLYRDLDLRLQKIEADYALQSALDVQVQNLKELAASVGTLRDSVKVLYDCCEDVKPLMPGLQDLLNSLAAAGIDPKTLGSSLSDMNLLITQITNQYGDINNFITNIAVSKEELDSAMNLLRDEMSKLPGCNCDLERIARIEKTANDALALAQDASDRVNKAQETADAAKSLAETAKSVADAAKTAADKAQDAADKAQADATQAGKDAAAAKEAADKAKEAADKAQEVADKAQALAESVESIAKAADKLSKENKEAIDKHTEAISKIELQIVSMSDSLKHAYETADNAWAQALGNKIAIEKLDSTIKSHKAIIDEMKTVVDKIPGLEENVSNLNNSVSNLYNKVDSLGGEIDDLKDEIIKLYVYADANLEKAKAYTDLEVALVRADIANINIDIFNLREDLNGAVEEIGDEIQKIKDAVDVINDSLSKIDNRVTENATKIGEVEEKLGQVEKDFQDKIDALQKEIDDLTERVEKNEKDIADIFGQLDDLRNNLAKQVTGIIVQGTVNPAFGSINLPVNIQSNVLLAYYGKADHDIVFPTNDPTYYVDDRFVLSWKDLNLLGLNNSEPIFKSGDVIMQNDEYNAGTLYLTINPNTVNFEDLKLSLENSQEEASYVKLGELKKSDKVLQLGYSRAGNNGFYECYAKVNPEDVDKVQKISLNASGLKDDIKELLDKSISKRTVSLKDLAVDLAELVNSLKLDANAVKCEWEDVDGQKHAVYSNYNIAATAAEPLSLESYKDLNFKKVPGYNHVVYWLDKAVGKVKSDIHVIMWDAYDQPIVKKIRNLTVNKLDIVDDIQEKTVQGFSISKEIEIDGTDYTLGLTDVTVPIIYTDAPFDLSSLGVTKSCVVISGANNKATVVVPVKNGTTIVGYAAVPAGNVEVKASSNPAAVDVVIGKQTITVNKDATTNIKLSEIIQFDAMTVTVNVDLTKELNEFWDKYQNDFVDTNTSLEQIKAIVQDANNMLDLWNHYEDRLDAFVDSYKTSVMKYVNYYNNKLVNFINNLNLRLQPVLFASDENGAKALSEAKEYPSVMGKDINFIATTWSMELLAPMAKKHVAVTDVINGDKSAKGDDATCLAELKRVNSSSAMNAVLPGDINRAYATNLKSGYIYEVAYSALDFHGKIATRKYYIKVK